MRQMAVVLPWFAMAFLLGVAIAALVFPSKYVSIHVDEWTCTRTEKVGPKQEPQCVVYERKGWR